MDELADNRIVKAFAELRKAGSKTLLPFVTAGHPSLEATEALLRDFERRGVRVCELGIPFSDPIADGPVIQSSYSDALAAGIDTRAIFEMLRRYRQGGGSLGVLAMVSYSIVFRRGVDAFLAAARDAGFDGLIVPDLPLNEAAEFEPAARSHGLANVLLIAPTTPPDRRVEIARHCTGFIYYISVAGTTGERDRLPEQTVVGVAELRRHTETPICVGFGISRPEIVAAVCETADGAIVGSAIVHRIADAKDLPVDQMVQKVGGFVTELLEPLQ